MYNNGVLFLQLRRVEAEIGSENDCCQINKKMKRKRKHKGSVSIGPRDDDEMGGVNSLSTETQLTCSLSKRWVELGFGCSLIRAEIATKYQVLIMGKLVIKTL